MKVKIIADLEQEKLEEVKQVLEDAGFEVVMVDPQVEGKSDKKPGRKSYRISWHVAWRDGAGKGEGRERTPAWFYRH